MTKLKLYIDFEAISSPFDRELTISRDFPYAYSLGLYSGKKFKHRTFIFNFNEDSTEDVFEQLRWQIIRDVRTMLDKREFRINRETVEFVSYAPALEKKILGKVYRGIKVTDISKGAMISLGKATEKYIPQDNYFVYLKKYVDKYVDKKFVEKRGLVHDGALAALAGYLLCANALKQDAKNYHDDLDVRTLVKEIAVYSADDVIRMQVIEEHKEEFFDVAEKRKTNILRRGKLLTKKAKIDKVKAFIATRDKDLTIKELIKQLKEESDVLDADINDVEI